MPDFARKVYRNESGNGMAVERFKALQGTAAKPLLQARAEFLHIMGLLAGKWPHSLAIQPGGCTAPVGAKEQARLLAVLYAFRGFLETTLFGDSLEAIVQLDSWQALQAWADERSPEQSDFRRFLHISRALGLERIGRGGDLFMSYGAYPTAGERLFPGGVWRGELRPLDPGTIAEDVSHSWMSHQQAPRHPYDGVTLPDVQMEEGYSWCKALGLGGQAVEVAALARISHQADAMNEK